MTSFPYELRAQVIAPTTTLNSSNKRLVAGLFILAFVIAQACSTGNPTAGPSKNSGSAKSSNMGGGATSSPSPSSDCDPNYSGCVPIASDVDCAGGSGNGPAYVKGPVRVIGKDIYGLDRDRDGIGCE